MNKLQRLLAWFLIPKGYYCEGCPFWFVDTGKPKQMNGYCSYLGKGDWDFYKEMSAQIKVSKRQPNGSYKDEIIDKDPMFSTLLWDGVKECHKR